MEEGFHPSPKRGILAFRETTTAGDQNEKELFMDNRIVASLTGRGTYRKVRYYKE